MPGLAGQGADEDVRRFGLQQGNHAGHFVDLQLATRPLRGVLGRLAAPRTQLRAQLVELGDHGRIDLAPVAAFGYQVVLLVAARHVHVLRRQRPAQRLHRVAEARAGQQGADAAVQVAEHAPELLLVGAEHQRLQVVRHFRVAIGLDESARQATRADRVGPRLHLQFFGEPVELGAHDLQRLGEPGFDRFGQLLAGQVERQLVFGDQRQGQVAAITDAQRAEVVEALGDLLPVAHHVGRRLLAHFHQCLHFDVASGAGALGGVVQGHFDRCIDAAGHRPEQLDRQPLDLFKHARRIRAEGIRLRGPGHHRRIISHCFHLPRFRAG